MEYGEYFIEISQNKEMSFSMNIAICDDNLIDREIVSQLLALYFSQKSIAYQITLYQEGRTLIQDIEDGDTYDIIILDIFLGKHLGIDVARKLRKIQYKGDIIFLTVSSDYAVESYDVEASGYLLKPHSFAKLCRVMDHILEKYQVSTYDIYYRSKLIRIPYNQILYVESRNNKCILHDLNGEEHIIYKKLSTIEEELDDPRFLRCHQSYLVNMNHIQRADDQFTLFTGDTIMIRKKNAKEIRNHYIQYLKQREP